MESYDTEPREETQTPTLSDEPIVSDDTAVELSEGVQEQDVIDLDSITPGPYLGATVQGHGDNERVMPLKRHWFVPPSREQWQNWGPFLGLMLLGAILRFWGLGDKPLHHDESLHAYFSLQLLHNNIQNWISCFSPYASCYHYDPLLHGPFQFHAIALVYQISQWLGAPDHGVNTFTVRIPAAVLGTVIIGLPYFMRDYLGKVGSWLAALLLAVSPSMVYFSRFAREDIYMACFTLLMVVAVGRYVKERKLRWIVLAACGFALSYATSEATFLTIAVFGSFLGALIVWELGKKWAVRESVNSDAAFKRYLPKTGAPILLVVYFLIIGPVAKIALGFLEQLSAYIVNPKNTPIADAFVATLKARTVQLIPWLGILLGLYILSILAREIMGKMPPPGRRGLAKYIDPQRQPLLDTILTMEWTHWFFALICAWTIFLVLFTALFTYVAGGIGDGIWQGLYYWLQQQNVARGGQPWYYYLMLIPLYEQIGVVFGIVGIVRCLLKPNAFRLFMVYWFVGDFVIYSWAGEKMPWLMIFMTMPLMILAAIGLEPSVVALLNAFKSRWSRAGSQAVATGEAGDTPFVARLARPAFNKRVLIGAAATIFFAFLLLLPTLHNMYEVSYVHAADGPHEMMVYVQTTTDVNIVMAKLSVLDQKIDGGSHQLSIGVMSDAEWPFAWYLRDYTSVCYGFPTACPTMVNQVQVIITGGDNLYTAEAQYGKGYLYQPYKMRTWWDEGYKPLPCVPTKANNNCAGQQMWGGVGPLLWLSYGDNPPPGAKFNLGLAAKNVWDWWWYRKAIGSTDGAYMMGLFIRKGLNVTP